MSREILSTFKVKRRYAKPFHRKNIKRWKATEFIPKFPEPIAPFFENIQSLFLCNGNIKLVILELSFQWNRFVFFSR